jgi:hypothetical protein
MIEGLLYGTSIPQPEVASCCLLLMLHQGSLYCLASFLDSLHKEGKLGNGSVLRDIGPQLIVRLPLHFSHIYHNSNIK